MIRASVLIAISNELNECVPPGADEAERRNRRLRFVGQVVGEEQAAERDRLIAAIVYLKPIATARRISHPFVDFERRHTAEAGGGVRRGWGRLGQRPVSRPVGYTANGEVWRLQTKAYAVEQRTTGRRAVEQEYRIALGTE